MQTGPKSGCLLTSRTSGTALPTAPAMATVPRTSTHTSDEAPGTQAGAGWVSQRAPGFLSVTWEGCQPCPPYSTSEGLVAAWETSHTCQGDHAFSLTSAPDHIVGQQCEGACSHFSPVLTS